MTSSPPNDAPAAPAKAPADALVGHVIGERYRIDAVLAKGGMGVVYRAEHLHMRKEVAIKILQKQAEGFPELVTRFEREAIAGAHISHANVATAHDFGTFDGESRYLVMELVKGVTLREIIDRGPTSVERTLRILVQLASALGGAHEKGIVHRDVKPRNVMVEEEHEDEVKLIDFGFARVPADRLFPSISDDDMSRKSITEPGAVFGTIAYMAPETALGMGSVDERSDLYAAGVIFYELLAGAHPFDQKDPYKQFAQTRNEAPPPIGERTPAVSVPAPVEAVLRKLLQKDPADRYQTAKELVSALSELRASRSAPSPPAPVATEDAPKEVDEAPLPIAPATPTRSNARWPMLVALNLAVLTVVAFLVLARRSDRPREVVAVPGSALPVSSPSSTSATAPPPSGSASSDLLALRFRMLHEAAGPDLPTGPPSLLALAEGDPTAFWDAQVKAAASTIASRAATRGGDDADRIFYALSYKLGSDGLDILYDVIASGKSTRGSTRAKATLSSPDIHARATPAMRVAFDLRRVPCQDKPRLFPLAGSDGDERVLVVLDALRDRHCDPKLGHCCVRGNDALDRAVAAVRGRTP